MDVRYCFNFLCRISNTLERKVWWSCLLPQRIYVRHPAHIYVHTIQGLSCWLLGWSNWWWCNITFGCVCVCVVPRIHAASSRDCSIEWLPNTWLHVCCQPRIHAASTYCSQAGLPNTTSMSYGLKNMKPDRSRVLLIVRNKFIHHPKTNYQRTAQQRSGERTNNKCTGTHQHSTSAGRQVPAHRPQCRQPRPPQQRWQRTTTGGHAPTAWSEQIGPTAVAPMWPTTYSNAINDNDNRAHARAKISNNSKQLPAPP